MLSFIVTDVNGFSSVRRTLRNGLRTTTRMSFQDSGVFLTGPAFTAS